jgi:hypothetical protein
LVALEARSFFALESFHGNRPELDTLDRLPGLPVPFENPHPVETGVFESFQEKILTKGPGQTSAPEFRIGLEMTGDVLVADDIRDHGTAALFENPVHFPEETGLVFRAYQVDYAIADDDVDGCGRDHGIHPPLVLLPRLESLEVLAVDDGTVGQVPVDLAAIEGEVLDLTLEEGHIVVAEAIAHLGPVAVGERQHVIVHIHADDVTFRSDDLRRDVTNLAASTPEIEHCLTGAEVLGRVPATVVAVDNLPWDDLEV